jgi:hypothetical protein
MTTTINASNSGSGGLVQTADASGILALQTAGTTAVTIDASQRTAFVAGTAALPAITTTGDTNTGIFFPAADTIAFAEGGVESMRIDSSGNLGIGTTSPDAKLTIKQTANSTLNGLKIIRSDTTSYIVMYVGGDDGLYIQNQQAGDTIFYNNSAERFRFGSAGQLGVAGANYGTSGQVLTSGGSGAAPSWAAVAGFGVGQTLTNYSSSGRAMGTTYTNSTGKPIAVMFNPIASANLFCSALIDGNVVEFQQFTPSGGGGCAAFFIMVPNGSTYQMRNDGNAGISNWYEWR